jgi:hypothetical protein
MFICDDTQTLIPAQVKQDGWNLVFQRGSVIGPESLVGLLEWILKQDENVYM